MLTNISFNIIRDLYNIVLYFNGIANLVFKLFTNKWIQFLIKSIQSFFKI